jgi:hypothetical protein
MHLKQAILSVLPFSSNTEKSAKLSGLDENLSKHSINSFSINEQNIYNPKEYNNKPNRQKSIFQSLKDRSFLVKSCFH